MWSPRSELRPPALTEAFYSFGFRLSFGDHKTAAVVTLFGRRSREIKKRLYGNAGLKGAVPILLEHLPTMLLPLPAKYKHLGVYQSPAGGIRDEIQHRVQGLQIQSHSPPAQGYLIGVHCAFTAPARSRGVASSHQKRLRCLLRGCMGLLPQHCQYPLRQRPEPFCTYLLFNSAAASTIDSSSPRQAVHTSPSS